MKTIVVVAFVDVAVFVAARVTVVFQQFAYVTSATAAAYVAVPNAGVVVVVDVHVVVFDDVVAAERLVEGSGSGDCR